MTTKEIIYHVIKCVKCGLEMEVPIKYIRPQDDEKILCHDCDRNTLEVL